MGSLIMTDALLTIRCGDPGCRRRDWVARVYAGAAGEYLIEFRAGVKPSSELVDELRYEAYVHEEPEAVRVLAALARDPSAAGGPEPMPLGSRDVWFLACRRHGDAAVTSDRVRWAIERTGRRNLVLPVTDFRRGEPGS